MAVRGSKANRRCLDAHQVDRAAHLTRERRERLDLIGLGGILSRRSAQNRVREHAREPEVSGDQQQASAHDAEAARSRRCRERACARIEHRRAPTYPRSHPSPPIRPCSSSVRASASYAGALRGRSLRPRRRRVARAARDCERRRPSMVAGRGSRPVAISTYGYGMNVSVSSTSDGKADHTSCRIPPRPCHLIAPVNSNCDNRSNPTPRKARCAEGTSVSARVYARIAAA